MSSFSIWHWIVVLAVLALPFWLIYLAVRAGVRHGLKDRDDEQ